ncbi:MAG: hypothetical protein H6625_04855 [Bdellovibrionaceae bacterium]|nr:hypothetical protein [Pseudobdellovibrionaceae bacterium]
MSLENLSSILECPRSKGSISIKNGLLHSENAGISFDSYLGIPWFFREPEIQLYQWQNSLKSLVFYLQGQTTILEQQINIADLGTKTKNRLLLLKEAIHFNAEKLFEILEPLIASGEVSKPISQKLVLEKLPHTQHLNSYFHTLFRDWSWATQESHQFSEQVISLFKNEKPKNIVFLGSGASRLSLDVHNYFTPELSLAMDINPLLFFCAKKVMGGEAIEFYEIPIAPLLLKDCAVKQNLSYKGVAPQNFEFIFSDAVNLPCKPKSLQAVVTPWFIDIVNQDFSKLAKKINHCLEKEACWINYGPLGYDNFKAQSYSKEELEEQLVNSGFKIENISIFEMDYLVSPHSSQSRREKVLGFCARKEKDAKEPPHFTYLPKWIADANEPIPRTEIMEQVQIRNQVAYELLNTINGKRSRKDIVPLMVNHYGMTQEMAEETLITFLINYYERRV